MYDLTQLDTFQPLTGLTSRRMYGHEACTQPLRTISCGVADVEQGISSPSLQVRERYVYKLLCLTPLVRISPRLPPPPPAPPSARPNPARSRIRTPPLPPAGY